MIPRAKQPTQIHRRQWKTYYYLEFLFFGETNWNSNPKSILDFEKKTPAQTQNVEDGGQYKDKIILVFTVAIAQAQDISLMEQSKT